MIDPRGSLLTHVTGYSNPNLKKQSRQFRLVPMDDPNVTSFSFTRVRVTDILETYLEVCCRPNMLRNNRPDRGRSIHYP